MTPVPAFARMQMTTAEKRARIAETTRIEQDLIHERVTLQLEVEMDEGRPDSYIARWSRAWLAGDMDECRRMTEAQYPKQTEVLS